MRTPEGGRDAPPTAGGTPALRKPGPSFLTPENPSASDRSAGVPPAVAGGPVACSALGHISRDVLRNRTSASRTWYLGFGRDRLLWWLLARWITPGWQPWAAARWLLPRFWLEFPQPHGGAGQRSQRSAICGDRRSRRPAGHSDCGAGRVAISAAGLYTFQSVRYRQAAAGAPAGTPA